ncbi:MAG: hypothetical protein C5B50_22100 [Verrucomicrobia bacterium]|nr:MAG: hypothetical protein C5B50_22100 [Verrucomicrobiota bacterium]
MKKILLVGSFGAVCALVGLWFLGRPAYRHYKEKRALELARTFAAKGDYRNASLSARQACQINPKNIEACRLLAEIAEKSHLPAALDWRKRLTELEPTVDNKILLAATALDVQGPPFGLATQVLDELAEAAKDKAPYYTVRAKLALRQSNPQLAEKYFAEAIRLEPNNETNQLDLAALRLGSTNSAALAEAHEALVKLRNNPQVGHVASHWLLAESLNRKDLKAAQEISNELISAPNATLDDRLEHLAILQQRDRAEAQTYLASLQKAAGTNALEIYTMTGWMLGHGLADEALRWHNELPQKTQDEQPVPLARVNCYQAKKDWTGLETYLQKQKWNELEFLRFAFLSQSALQQHQDAVADTRWRTAMHKGEDRLGSLAALLSLADAWGRTQAREDLLWAIAERFPTERWALAELKRLFMAAGNTRGLNKLYTTVMIYDSANKFAKNEVTATSLLLKINLADAHKSARELYNERPNDPVIASTYAYSLQLQNKTKDGLAVMEKLKAEELETPDIALYYGLLLSADGQTGKAARYFTLARTATLLPEEKELLAGGASGTH